ncbi:MAG TPA: hypothetical protein ACFE0H_01430 [Elainellaceae cyanobacterium]
MCFSRAVQPHYYLKRDRPCPDNGDRPVLRISVAQSSENTVSAHRMQTTSASHR